MSKSRRFLAALLVLFVIVSGCGTGGSDTESGIHNPVTGETGNTESETDSTVDTETEGQSESESATETETVVETETETETETEKEPVVTTFTLNAVGDCALGILQTHGYKYSFHQYYTEQGEAWFFDKVKDIFEADDMTLINLECVFTDETDRVDKTFNIKGEPGYSGILTAGSVEVCSLANNHTRDYGEASLEDTKESLESVGVLYAYEDVVAYYETEEGIKVAVLSANLLSAQDEVVLFETLKKVRPEVDLVIAACHWGVEMSYYPNDYQKNTAHELIDAGVDLIIGHHPHVLQGIEYYKGKMICYSLSNFSFGANRNPSDKNTMIYQQTFTFVDGVLQPGIDANIIPCRMSGKDSYNNFQPIVAQGSQATTILEKMREYSAAFTQVGFDDEGNIIIVE